MTADSALLAVFRDKSPATLVGWAVAILVTGYAVTAVRTWYRLRHIPGPAAGVLLVPVDGA